MRLYEALYMAARGAALVVAMHCVCLRASARSARFEISVLSATCRVIQRGRGSSTVSWQVVLLNRNKAHLRTKGQLLFLDSVGALLARGGFDTKIGPLQHRLLIGQLAMPTGVADHIARLRAIPTSIQVARPPTITKRAQRVEHNGSAPGEGRVSVVSLRWKVRDPDTESASVAWIVRVENDTRRERRVMGRVQYLDAGGYVVDVDLFAGYVGAGQSIALRGLTPVGPEEAAEIIDARASIVDSYAPEP